MAKVAKHNENYKEQNNVPIRHYVLMLLILAILLALSTLSMAIASSKDSDYDDIESSSTNSNELSNIEYPDLINNSNVLDASENSAVEDNVLTVEGYVDEGLEASFFNINYSDGKKVTCHYGYIDDNGTYHDNALTSCQPNDLSRDARAKEGDAKQIENLVCFNHYAQEIKNENSIYTFQVAYAYAVPGTSSAVRATGLYRNSNKWYTTVNGSSWTEKSSNSNIDVYFVYRAQSPNSFYNVKLGSGSNTGTLTVHSQYLDSSGRYNDLNGGVTKIADINLGTSGSFNFYETYNNHIVYANDTAYSFNSIRTNSSTGSQYSITNIRGTYQDKKYKWEYSTNYGSNWTQFSSSKTASIYVIYDYSVPTIDSKSKGIKLNMYDYDAWINNSGLHDGGISQLSNFKFGGNNARFRVNKWESGWDMKASNGIMSSLLNINKDPVISTKRFTTDEMKDPLYIDSDDTSIYFRPGGAGVSAGYKSDFTDLNHFFDEKEYKDHGYFYYNSSDHFISLNRQTKDFVQRKNPSAVDKKANFMPFDYMPSGNSCDIFGNNYLFSFTIETDFIQPKDGKVEWFNETEEKKEINNMQFEFEGDDDVYVFIDDVLVLDIGGLHNSIKGSVDFSTGTVTNPDWYWTNSQNSRVSNLKTIFKNAGRESSTSWTGNTFANYSRHKMKVYYMERGKNISNALFKFNLASMTEKSIQLGKGLTQIDGHITHRDEEYEYYVLKKSATEGSEIEPFSGKYPVYKGSVGAIGDFIEYRETDPNEEGVIKLHAGEVAVLLNFEEGSTYEIYEYDALMDPSETEEGQLYGYKWDFTINGSYQPSDFKRITHPQTRKVFFGLKDLSSDLLAGLQYQNIYAAKTYKLHIQRDDVLTGFSSDVLVKFNNEPFVGKYDIYNKDGSIKHAGLTTNNGKINGQLTCNGEYILIDGLELGVPVEVSTIDEQSKTLFNSYNSPEPYALENIVAARDSKQINGDIPNSYQPDIDQEKLVGKIVLSLSKYPLIDLNFKKIINGAYADKTKQFEIMGMLYNRQGEVFSTSSSTFYSGVIHRKSGEDESISLVVLDGTEGCGPKGTIKIVNVDSETGDKSYTNPALADGDILFIKEIMPSKGFLDLYEEAYINHEYNYSAAASASVGTSGVEQPANLDLSTEIDEPIWSGDTHWESTNKISSTDEISPINVKYVNTFDEIIPTGFEIDNIWVMILIVVLIMLALWIFKLAFKLNRIHKNG